MIQKMTSHELNDILNNANEKLESVIADVRHIKSDISKKLKIMRYETDYMEEQMEEVKTVHKETIREYVPGQNRKVFAMPNSKLSNSYEQYGSTMTPKLKTAPVNVFNILTAAAGEAFYRDIAEVTINGTTKEEYKSILKHDSLGDKVIFFEELDGENPSLEISIVLDKTKTLGNSLFNMMEIDTFLNGAYTLDYIRLYSDEIVNSDTAKYDEFKSIENAGKMRLIFNKSYSFTRVDIKITPTFKTKVDGMDRHPIGIKHIYFYNASFSTDSYAIVEIESEDFIDKIDNRFTLIKPGEEVELEADNEGIQFFLNYSINQSSKEPILSILQEPSRPGNTKVISTNVKKIYAKVPIRVFMATTSDEEAINQSAIGFVFEISSKII